MMRPVWADVPLEWRCETVIAMCRIALNHPDPDAAIQDWLDEAGDGDEAAIVFSCFAWSQLRHLDQLHLELEMRLVRAILEAGDPAAGRDVF